MRLHSDDIEITDLSLLVIYHYIVRLDIPMHDALAMTEVQRLKREHIHT